MSVNWGPGFDAEIDYRLARARIDFGRTNIRRKARIRKATSPSPRQPVLAPRPAL